MNIGDIWFDESSWKFWDGEKWLDTSFDPTLISCEEKIKYLYDQLTQITAIADSYIELEELVRDYVANAAANDKWKWKFKDALKELECF